MKKTFDKNGRTLYKFSHSVAQGGNVYIHKTKQDSISNKKGLENNLNAIITKYKLIDATIKIYDNIFFLFFHMPNSIAPIKLIEIIQKNLNSFAEWDDKYGFEGIYDLHEKDIKNYLKHNGFEYDEG